MASEGSTPVNLDDCLSKGKKLPLKRVKKKSELNISKGKLKSISKQHNFSFLNASVQKQTLRENNRALAQSLAKAREEMRNMHKVNKDLLAQNQDLVIKVNRLKRVAGMRDDEIETELQKRNKQMMQSLKKLCEDASRSMMQSSESLNSIYDVCVEQSRRSTGIGEGRGSSMGAGEDRQASANGGEEGPVSSTAGEDGPGLSMRDAVLVKDAVQSGPRRKVFQSDCARPLADLPVKSSSVFNSGVSDISMILEQSVLDDGMTDGLEYVAVPLEPVKEVHIDTSLVVPSESIHTQKSQVLSKLPQRVAKGGSAVAENNEKPDTAKKGACEKPDFEKETVQVKSKSKSDKTSKEKSKGSKSTEIKKNEKVSKTNAVVSKNTKQVDDILPEKVVNVDADSETDISLFGFGRNFASELVSGSPIISNKIEDKSVPATKSKSETMNKHSDKQSNEKLRRETFVLPQPGAAVIQEMEVQSSKDKSKDSLKQKPFETSKPTQKLSQSALSSSLSRIDKKMPSSSKEQKTPEKSKPVAVIQEQTYSAVSNPFKPTKCLLRSPPPVPYQKTSEEPSIDSRAFIASLRQSSETAFQRSPLPEPRFSHEPTMIFNSDMEFTEIFDSSKLPSFNKSDKVSPNIPESIPEYSNTLAKSVQDLTNKEVSNAKDMESHEFLKPSSKHIPKAAKEKPSKSKTSKPDEEVTVVDTLDGPSVEVRSKKPGVFTFNVGRKEADGTRKAVPEETTSRARSKKAKAVMSEKTEERRTGEDRDMFNFGDRSPTIPLDKLVKPVTKSVYDLSINESVVQTGSLHSLRDNKKTPALPEAKPDECIYYLPMPKGSPEDKPAASKSRSRSKSNTRSKSKTRHKSGENDEDDDWVPGKSRARARSASRSRKTFDVNEPVAPRRGRSRSRVRKSSESLAADKNNADEERDEIEKDDSKKEVEGERGRSRSQARKPDLDDGCKNSNPDEVIRDEIEKDDSKKEVEGRKGRSKSRARKPDLDDDCKKSNSEEVICSKSRPGKNAKEDEIDIDADELEVTQLERKSRSKSIQKRKTYVLDNVEEDKKERTLNNKLVAESPDVKKSQQTRVKSIVVVNSDNESSGSDNSDKRAIAETFCIGDSDSDNVEEATLSKATQPACKKSVTKKVLMVESETESEAKSSVANEKSREIEELSIRVPDNFITKSRARRSKRLSSIDPDPVDDHGLEVLENLIADEKKVSAVKESECNQGKISRTVRKSRSKVSYAVDSLNDEDEDESKSPTPKKKLKSAKKSVKKKKGEADTSADVKKSKAKLQLEDEDTEDSKKSVPLKTPAMCEDTVASKKGATKSSRKGKSTSKRPPNQNSAGVDEGTPKAKKSKASADNPTESEIAVLKKRLTMIMNSKNASTLDRKNEAPLKVADLDRTVEENPVLQDLKMEPIHDDDDDSDRKHRRNRNPVSYVPKPLNLKLRQGDQMFVENGNSNKVKAEISRLAIARKTCVPKVSRDDKENVDQTKTK
ncbi:microtubule-associated protein futsch-like isoform X1 [Dreissena polymorpha]|nr:microtubule-associated protein futsch-like isoform X1 [Dreissena polymorpha]XP_052246744.1 microtubule-associated protein futsch-like isoform X1 [Dreissena polymorpha]